MLLEDSAEEKEARKSAVPIVLGLEDGKLSALLSRDHWPFTNPVQRGVVVELVHRLRCNRPVGSDADGVGFLYREGLNSAMEAEAGAREFTLAGAAEHASAKVKRRCPYSFGAKAADGPCPDRATEEAAWGAVKTAEKASKAPGGEPMPPPPPTYDSVFQYVARRGLMGLVGVDAAYGLPALAVAFGVGAVVGSRCGR